MLMDPCNLEIMSLQENLKSKFLFSLRSHLRPLTFLLHQCPHK